MLDGIEASARGDQVDRSGIRGALPLPWGEGFRFIDGAEPPSLGSLLRCDPTSHRWGEVNQARSPIDSIKNHLALAPTEATELKSLTGIPRRLVIFASRLGEFE